MKARQPNLNLALPDQRLTLILGEAPAIRTPIGRGTSRKVLEGAARATYSMANPVR